MPRRCALGCPRNIRGLLHVIPSPDKYPEQHKSWVRIVTGNQDNQDFDYTKHRVCDRHFTDRDRTRSSRLNVLAVPSLFLPDKMKSKIKMKSVSDTSSDDDDDDIPLQHIKMNGYIEDPNSYDSLCKHSIEACEFCDQISINRYSSLIHNVKHIIIPLLNQTIYQCEDCLHHFTSQEDLKVHERKKHHVDIIVERDLVKKETIILKEDFEVPTREKSVEILKDPPKVQPIKNRLLFEDDVNDIIVLNCNRLLNDLTTDCKVNLELFKPPWLCDDQFKDKSIHFDDLTKPGFFRCKKCGIGFPNRYEAIIHESSHISFKNSLVTLCGICNQYIVGNNNDLRIHYLNNHTEKPREFHQKQIDTYRQPQTYENSFLNYISDVTAVKHKTIDEERNENSVRSKTFMMCEMCFKFCKNRKFMNYECVGHISQAGRRFTCEKCGLQFFEIKLVRRFTKARNLPTHHKKKKLSNEERLKSIQHRFKMMKY